MKGPDFSIYLFDNNIWSYYYCDRFGWFRLFGIGFRWKDTTKHKLLFSERNGYDKAITINN